MHHGTSIMSGHYTTCCLLGDKWMHYDDTSVTEIDATFLHDKVVLEAAYVLLYQKIELDENNNDEQNNRAETNQSDPGFFPSERDLHCDSADLPQESDHDYEISLFEDEVPGAMLTEGLPIEKHTMDVLVRWLQCRGINLGKCKKPDLVSRVKEEIANGRSAILFKQVDGGTWFKAKLAKINNPSTSNEYDHDLERSVVAEEKMAVVELTENDVEGAKLGSKTFQCTTVKEMKKYLELRGQSTTGNKIDLWERIQELRESGTSHILDPSVSNQFYYKQKQEADLKKIGLRPVRQQFPLPSSGWNVFPSVEVPKHFNEGMSFHFLVERHPNDEDSINFHTAKPGKRAKIYIDSGYVIDMEDCADDKMYYLRCKVKASLRNIFHSTSVVISRNSGSVLYGDCDCIASSLGRCNHVAAVLRCLWTYNLQPQGVACTSLPQQWGHGARNRKPGVVRDTDYPSRASITEKAHFDPRATGDIFRSPSLEFAIQFRNSLPKEPMLLWHDVLPSTDNSIDEEPSGDVQDNAVTNNMVPTIDFSSPPKELTIPQQCRNYLNMIKNLFLNNLSDDGTSYVEIPNTKQGTSNWLAERGPYITSSTACKVKCLTTPEAKKNFLARLMWGLNPFTNEAIKYGIRNEPIAREEYRKKMLLHYNKVDIKVPARQTIGDMATSQRHGQENRNTSIEYQRYSHMPHENTVTPQSP
ncbi:Ubiquitin carboxyl-terminal hydrolase 3 [Frankliniella fusca]|uniref:Ubiquitin carboxyl-terminal hydrolase 3 n=1 Tax=Frankliniella fusca TaxID=407009 RepID=A0AAE1L880_9NEOP|nr:Ubiquitin carboxyl-terminal hydrolase 3 [Frankliniella fusca]